ncbi:MAG TPA: hypothetical protein VK209_00060 [Candidatus Sulfotelmatobacter sp.]|nr:hypothetical protein [Candidatus Sulfotelmatobacter sp.]
MAKDLKPFKNEGICKQVSPWLASARNQFIGNELAVPAEYDRCGFQFSVKKSTDTLWLMINCAKGRGEY